LNWLTFLDTLGFGACLADDMGLGKTIQVLAFLSTFIAKEPDRTSLLVVPASLLANWEGEIRRFLPDLKYGMAHPGYEKQTGVKQRTRVQWERFDLVITTYAMVQRHEWMQAVPWRVLILDEAQAIKNPSTRQSKTVKKLLSDTRITMTGTPIENSLSDLWSLFDFINPGLLGSPTEFKAFLKDLKTDPSGYGRLKQVVSPYILRRMKTDKKIAPDLPDKVEMRTFPELSKKQRVLYMDFVNELENRLEQSAHGIQRKGLVLSALVKFKQICNHPDQYLGTGGFAPEESGKFVRLKEICETIHAKRERVLVFTQFKEMVAPLQAFLETVFHQSGCIIHGSLNVRQRQQSIELFQGKDYLPFMVLSLKAGGTGLNLTRANHVIHFDRWWNPAVENQATDRVFRIGQTKGVLVHKFITRGTIEEKIDLMIEKKKELADQVISDSQGTWITKMDDRELMALFTLKI
jgi:non-specific serine/threonine protein kinase